MHFNSGFWRKCRIGFRWLRIVTLLAVLALVCAAVWLNRVGLPDFLKRPLIETLRARGVELEFSRLRLRFVRGLVAENVRIGHAGTPGSPTFSVREIQVRVNHRALWHRRLQIDGLVLREGKLTWPVLETNGPPRALVLDHIQTELRFQPDDTWSLADFRADFAGAHVTLSGDIAHASALPGWEIFHGGKSASRAAWQARLRQFSEILDRVHFEGTPDFHLSLKGDARNLQSFVMSLAIRAPKTDTPWGRVQRGWLTIQASPLRADRIPQAVLRFEAGEADTPWGGARDIQFAAHFGVSSNAPPADASWAWWENLQPYCLGWSARLARLQSEKLNADSIECGGLWRAPELVVTNLSAKLGGGQLAAQARLDVATRELAFTNSSCFDMNAMAGLLTEKTRRWLAQFSWPQPPSLRATGLLILPAWTNRQPDWRAEVQPTMRLAGEFAFTNGAFLGIGVGSAGSHFSYSNLVWRLPDLAVARPEGRLELTGVEDDHTKDYHWHIRGAFAPQALRPLLVTSNELRTLDDFTFAALAQIDADVWGRLYDYNRLGARGRVALTNFTVRGQTADSFESTVQYTNRLLEFFGPRLSRGTQIMAADGIAADFNAWRIYFTNAFSTADPLTVARAIGARTGQMMKPYRFTQPPMVGVDGFAPLRGVNDADLRFDVSGGPFEWWKLKVPRISGEAHWQSNTLVLTNVVAAFYGGNGAGSAVFDFRALHKGVDFQFTADVTNVNVRLLTADLSAHTNHLEGALSGHLVVTGANSTDWRTWNGYGRASLRDGLIWDIPVFGILSPALNAVVPGLGSSRATEARAQFAITQGVVFSDKLEIRSTMMRLQYAGTVDLKGRVDARVDAELLRDTWVVGPFVSTALWPVSKLFEYRITGTLDKPRGEPVYIPKLLLMPLHPIRSLEELFPTEDFFSDTPPGN